MVYYRVLTDKDGHWNSLMHAPPCVFIAESSGNAHLQPLDLYPLSSEMQPSAPSATGGHLTASVQNLISWPCYTLNSSKVSSTLFKPEER